MALSPNQIAQLANRAGFSGSALTMATAVAIAESSGNPEAYNPEAAAGTPPGLGSYGLWQIYRNAHPEFNGVDLYDPMNNAQAAYMVYRAAGNRFTPWSTYNNGAAGQIAQSLVGQPISNPEPASTITRGSKKGRTLGGGTSGGAGGEGGSLTTSPAPGLLNLGVPPTVTGSGPGGTSATTSTLPSPNAAGPLVSINLLPQALTDFLNSPQAKIRVTFAVVGLILIIVGLIMFTTITAGSAGQKFSAVQLEATKKVVPLVSSAGE